MNAISLSIFANRIDAICEEMGVTLQRAAFSPNIRDRLDYSCAIFDARGELCAQAPHIPVHLGSMAFAMSGIVNSIKWQAGDAGGERSFHGRECNQRWFGWCANPHDQHAEHAH